MHVDYGKVIYMNRLLEGHYMGMFTTTFMFAMHKYVFVDSLDKFRDQYKKIACSLIFFFTHNCCWISCG
jgi:hypothetical protein